MHFVHGFFMAQFWQMCFCLFYKYTCRIAVLKKLLGTAIEKIAPRALASTVVEQQQKRQSYRPSAQKDLKVKGVCYLYKKREVNQTGHVNYLLQRNKTASLSVSLLCLLCLFWTKRLKECCVIQVQILLWPLNFYKMP